MHLDEHILVPCGEVAHTEDPIEVALRLRVCLSSAALLDDVAPALLRSRRAIGVEELQQAEAHRGTVGPHLYKGTLPHHLDGRAHQHLAHRGQRHLAHRGQRLTPLETASDAWHGGACQCTKYTH